MQHSNSRVFAVVGVVVSCVLILGLPTHRMIPARAGDTAIRLEAQLQ
jgi:hypothetical protein